ncbi:MAG: trehalose-phosphatase [Deltaproteobacteria bacterium]|nr:trehalose-phosphatase [Deltaproteobacteria bacterium]
MSALLTGRTPQFLDLAFPGTLVVLDFDGTLARITRDHRDAKLSPRSRAALTSVAERYPVAILTGRRLSDAAARVEGVPVRWVIGSHGAEWPGDRVDQRTWRVMVLGWKRRITPFVQRIAGAELEDKGLSLSIHYRSAKRPDAAAVAIGELVARLPGARVIPGKRVANVVPENAPDKGSALWRLAVDTGAGRVLFVGDDDTDEVAFRARLPVPAVTVRVGYDARSAAAYHVGSRAGVDRLLDNLASLRDPASRRRRAFR